MSEEKKEKKEERIIEITGKDFKFKITRLDNDISFSFDISKDIWNKLREFLKKTREGEYEFGVEE
mgnify:FL=1